MIFSSQIRMLLPIAFSLVATSTIVHSQDLPNSVDPTQIERSFERPIELAAPPETQVPSPRKIDRPEGADDYLFVLKQIELTGAKKIPVDELLPLYADSLDQEIVLSNVFDIADSITAEYRRRGFIISQALVPAQKINEGIVQIRVVEGYVSEVDFVNSNQENSDSITTLGEDITTEVPLSLSAFERNMLLINDLPGVSAASSVGRSETGGVGAARVVISSLIDPWSGDIAINNRGSKQTGPGRLDFSVRKNTLSVGHTQIGARSILALDGSELALISAFADFGLGRAGISRLRFTTNIVQAEPDLQLAAFNDLETDAISFGIEYSRPLRRSRLSNIYIDASFGASNSNSKGQQVGDEFGTDTTTDTRKFSLGFSADYVHKSRAISQAEIRLFQGVDGLGAGDSRVQGNSPDLDFSKIEVYLSRLQPLGNSASILLALDGQIALSENLPSGELFGIGGQNFVRAYDASESSAESGIAVKVEVRLNATNIGETRALINPYLYVDAGVLDDSQQRDELSSIGGGVRFSQGQAGGYVEVGVPLDGEVAVEENDDTRLFAGFSYSF